MSKHSAELFPEGYSYQIGDLECKFHRDPLTRMWVVKIKEPGRREPAFTTVPTQDRFTAYATAQAWCATKSREGSQGTKNRMTVRSKA